MAHMSGPGLCVLVSSIVLCWNVLLAIGEVILEPPLGVTEDGELVVDKGLQFTLTCRGDSNLTWHYSDYESHPSQPRSQVDVQYRQEFGQFVSILTVRDAYYLDTGYFTCHPQSTDRHSPEARSIYVYVKDPENLLAVNDTFSIITKNQRETVELPCRPTDPSLQVALIKDGEEVSDVLYDPHAGFSFVVEAIHQSGVYECVVDGTDYTHMINLHVNIITHKDDIEMPHVSVTPKPVVEGMDIVFECSVHYDIGVVISLNWSLPEPRMLQSGRFVVHNTTSVDLKKNHMGQLRLEVRDVQKQDEGKYTCHVEDSSGNHNSNTFTLAVLRSSTLDLSLRGQKGSRPAEIRVNPGERNLQLLVDINAHPQPKQTQWYDNNLKPILSGDAAYEVKTTPTESKLTIREPDVRATGTYTLVVNNDAFNKSINVTLQVMGEPELRVNEGREKQFYLVGQEHKIDCEVFGLPTPNISWTFSPCDKYPHCDPVPHQIPPSLYSEMEVHSPHMPLKSTVQVNYTRTGILTCIACNYLGCKKENTTFLATDVEEGFSLEGPRQVVESDNVTLICGASKSNHSHDLQWAYSRGNEPPSSITDLKMWMEESLYSYFIKLNIPNVSQNRSGNYICTTSYLYERNKTLAATRKRYIMTVEKLERPVIHRQNITTKKSVRTGMRVNWQCIVKGTPHPTIMWFKDGKAISLAKKSNLELRDNNRTLEVLVGLEDDATYTCVAVNKAGQDTLVFQIELTDKPNKWMMYIFTIVLPVVVVIASLIAVVYACRVCKLRKEIRELTEAGLLHFEDGNVESLNPELDVGEQADLLPYNRDKWEFPRDKLKLGKQLGSGAFGVVLKAQAYELVEQGVATTVAVKMVKRNSDVATIKALASELKIMIHLGKHLNVVNVLGACTGDLNKRELLVLVEYCQYGNLHNYLLKHRGAFINQVNPRSGTFDPTLIQPTSPTSPTSPSGRFSGFGNGEMYSNGKVSMRTSAAFSHATDTTLVMSDMSEQSNADASTGVPQSTPVGEDGYLICRDHEWRNKDRGDYRDGLRPVCTQDLICWSFQIARGMEYLASRKVLHGDLAARNVLLADDNIVKICDFGFSKSMYTDSNYRKKGDGPLPVKWMALESIRDRVFSTQSDVWAYGITIWELFTLACTPYPGMEANERLFAKLAEGYRMEQPKYATNQVYKVMVDCWHVNPHSRPSFTELAERMGGMLEDTVRTHYVDLNDPFLEENSEFLAQQDYLSMLRSPSYANWSPTMPIDGYTTMKPAGRDTDEAMELTPMLDHTAESPSPPESPDGSPSISKPIGNNYVNVAHVLGFSNPSYHNLGRPKQTPYVNMPD